MKAMILAAGKGTRLLPLTKSIPKALVPVAGIPLLEIVLRRLIIYGFNEVIINVHHHAEQIIKFVQKKNHFNIRIEISKENTLLDTGGGLKNAAWFFDDDQPFLLHNVDVLTDMDYHAMLDFHKKRRALATLAVRKRESSRYLLFDEKESLCGWKSGSSEEVKTTGREKGQVRAYAFSGIHVISPQLFRWFGGESEFSIIDTYLKAAEQGASILAFPSDQWRWMDAGKREDLDRAEQLTREIID